METYDLFYLGKGRMAQIKGIYNLTHPASGLDAGVAPQTNTGIEEHLIM